MSRALDVLFLCTRNSARSILENMDAETLKQRPSEIGRADAKLV